MKPHRHPWVPGLLCLAGILSNWPIAHADAPSAGPSALITAQMQWPPVQPGGSLPRPGPPTSHLPAPQTGVFSDALGRFRATLPAGTEQVNATYMFTVPASALQINISVATRDQMFQSNMQMYPGMMQQSGAQVAQQPLDHRGRSATMVMAKMRDAQSGNSMQSLNVFIPGPNLWLQVNSPEQSAPQAEEAMRALLSGLQYP